MKRYDEKTKRNVTYFNTYEGVKDSCPHCQRKLGDWDHQQMKERGGQMNCLKCGNILKE